MNLNEKIPGAVIRRERLARGIEQKALCEGICVPSYLSKIERGLVCPNGEITAALYGRLGLEALEGKELKLADERVDAAYGRVLYNAGVNEAMALLEPLAAGLVNSPRAADWLILRGLAAGEDTTRALSDMADCLTERQRQQLVILKWKYGADRRPEPMREACFALGDSFALNAWAEACYVSADYGEVLRLEEKLTAQALEEGNTWQLANYYILKGSAYSCLFLEDMMLTYYRRAIHMLQNTGWKHALDDLYYNIGATMLSLKRFDEAACWFEKMQARDGALALHKRALLAIRRGDVQEGRALIEAMRRCLAADPQTSPADWLRAEEAEWECRTDFLESREYLGLLERLLAELGRDYHFGHVTFYQDVYLEACQRQRQYRKALEFQRTISERSVRIIV